MKKALQRNIAEKISHLFDPSVALSTLAILTAVRSGMTYFKFWEFIIIYFILIVGLPVCLLYWAVKNKRVSDWDISNRLQRVKALSIFLLFILFDILLVSFFGNIQLQHLFILLLAWFVGFYLITLFWKISGHMIAVTLVSLFIIYWYGINWLPTLLLIPLVGWARIVTKNHSLPQVIGGAIYSWLFFELVKLVKLV